MVALSTSRRKEKRVKQAYVNIWAQKLVSQTCFSEAMPTQGRFLFLNFIFKFQSLSQWKNLQEQVSCPHVHCTCMCTSAIKIVFVHNTLK